MVQWKKMLRLFYCTYILLIFWVGQSRRNDEVSTIPMDDKPVDPFAMELFMTRYYGGCFHELKNENYSQTIPWIRNFDLLITGCEVDWRNPLLSRGSSSCIWQFDDKSKKINADLFPELHEANRLLRVHVHSDAKHHRFFFEKVFPSLEEQYRSLNQRFILHSGGGDSTVNIVLARPILDSPAVARWVVEQNWFEEIAEHPKVLQLPVGICIRENFGPVGADLRRIRSDAEDHPSRQRRHRLLRDKAAKHMKAWHERLDRVFFCFHTGHPARAQLMDFVKSNCTICDYCPEATLRHIDLWEMYGKYKYVFSPFGNGFDCGRSWEILFLGAVPVIQYFPGARGYLDGGLPAVLTRDIAVDLTAQNLSEWNSRYVGHAIEHGRLSPQYWLRRAFLFHPVH